jgi:hypothetical protein
MYRCLDVRPTAYQFLNVLSGSPNLRHFMVDTSGPYFFNRLPQDAHFVDAELNYLENHLVTLEHLEHIHYGYTWSYDACKALKAINARNVQTLTLEDSTHPAATHEENAGTS